MVVRRVSRWIRPCASPRPFNTLLKRADVAGGHNVFDRQWSAAPTLPLKQTLAVQHGKTCAARRAPAAPPRRARNLALPKGAGLGGPPRPHRLHLSGSGVRSVRRP